MASRGGGAGLAIAVALVAWAVRTRVTTPVRPTSSSGGAGTGPERTMRRTGTTATAWRSSRLAAARAGLAELGIADEHVARAVAAHWALETGSGSAEHGFNVGNIRAFPDRHDSHPWHRWTDGLPYRDYDSLDAGVRDYLSLVSQGRYAAAWRALLAGGTAGDFAVQLAQAGYSAMRGGADQRRAEVNALAQRIAV